MAELEFRDGKREVPDHLIDLLRQIETFKMTYEEAVKAADELRMKQFLNTSMDGVLDTHFRTRR